MSSAKPKKILVSPLNWGLGHATRCKPLIKALLKIGHQVHLAGNGPSFSWLKQQFPSLSHYEIPGWEIIHPVEGTLLNQQLFDSPKLMKLMRAEFAATAQLQAKQQYDLIISDQRFGVRSKSCKSVIISHQLQLPVGMPVVFRRLGQRVNSKYLNQFNAQWVPDFDQTFSGDLSEKIEQSGAKDIGLLSRFSLKDNIQQSGFPLIMISGPDPIRSNYLELIEQKIRSESVSVNLIGKGALSRFENGKKISQTLEQIEIDQALVNASGVIATAGYSTLMDLTVLQKRCLLFALPNQFEQIYLCKKHEGKVARVRGEMDEMFNWEFLMNRPLSEILETLKNQQSLKPAQSSWGLKERLEQLIEELWY